MLSVTSKGSGARKAIVASASPSVGEVIVGTSPQTSAIFKVVATVNALVKIRAAIEGIGARNCESSLVTSGASAGASIGNTIRAHGNWVSVTSLEITTVSSALVLISAEGVRSTAHQSLIALPSSIARTKAIVVTARSSGASSMGVLSTASIFATIIRAFVDILASKRYGRAYNGLGSRPSTVAIGNIVTSVAVANVLVGIGAIGAIGVSAAGIGIAALVNIDAARSETGATNNQRRTLVTSIARALTLIQSRLSAGRSVTATINLALIDIDATVKGRISSESNRLGGSCTIGIGGKRAVRATASASVVNNLSTAVTVNIPGLDSVAAVLSALSDVSTNLVSSAAREGSRITRSASLGRPASSAFAEAVIGATLSASDVSSAAARS